MTSPRDPAHDPLVETGTGTGRIVPESPLLRTGPAPTASVRATDGERRRRAGWLPLAAAALAALLLAGLLVALLGGDDDGSTGAAGTSQDGTAQDSSEPGTGTDAGTDAGAGAGAPEGGTGTLVAGSTDVLADGGAGLAALAGSPATAAGIVVESVVADEGFWVGTPQSRVFVFLSPQARQSAGESGFQVVAGQAVELTGTVTPLDGDPAALGVEDAEGADQLRTQAAYVTADTVSLSS